MRSADPLALAGMAIRYGSGVWTLVLWAELFRDAYITDTLDNRGLILGGLLLLGADILARSGRFFLPPLLSRLLEKVPEHFFRAWRAAGSRHSRAAPTDSFPLEEPRLLTDQHFGALADVRSVHRSARPARPARGRTGGPVNARRGAPGGHPIARKFPNFATTDGYSVSTHLSNMLRLSRSSGV